ncbi:MAG: AAA family ATPase [Candidatus Thiodiazotropha sp.]|nr:AAA family ATPase [Candidatus Thiodiazotropha sp.]
MKVSELNLVAFGPFTERLLSFGKTGLHIVYGPNEAGKSSALRALKSLLYGIPERTTDNFVHANDRLRIAGILLSDDGNELRIARRKGRKNTLLGPDDVVLDDQVLAPFLQGVTAELFETIFGIDHQALVAGGQEILEQKGEVGQALFSAALGSQALHGVLAELDTQADALFRPRGSTQTINAAIKRYTELSKEVREHSLSSREWGEHRRALARTEKELEKIQGDLATQRADVNRLQRIQRVIPKLVRRRGLLQDLAELGEVVVLPDNFAERRQAAVSAMESARTIVEKALPRLEGLRKQLAGLSINEALLEQAENIEDLHMRLGSHRKAMRDRPNLDAEMRQLRTDAESLIKEVRPSLALQDAEQLRSVLGQRAEIIELGGQHGVLKAHMEQSGSTLRETEKRLQVVKKERDQVPQPRNTDELRTAIASARKLGDLDSTIQAARSELATLQTDCTNALARLTHWKGELDDVLRLALPGRETIQRYETDFEDLQNRIQRYEEKRTEFENSLQDVSIRLDEAIRIGEVPTEASLVETRKNRDQIWSLLRQKWEEGLDVSAEASHYESEGPLPEVFEHRLTDADEVSDRLRREADRVHALASLQANQEGTQEQIRQLADRFEATVEERNRLIEEWQALWVPCNLGPGTPREMRAWLDVFEKLRNQVEQLRSSEQKIDELQQLRITHVQRLKQLQTDLEGGSVDSGELEPMFLFCEALAERLDEARRKHETLHREVLEREADVAALAEEHRLASEAMDAWRAQWSAIMQSIGQPDEMPPSGIHEFIESVRMLFSKLADAEKLRLRIHAIDEEAEAFRNEVVPMVGEIAPDLADLSVDDAVGRLNTLLSDNQAKRTKRQQLEEQIDQTAQDLSEAKTSVEVMTERLDTLCVEAKCENHADLEEAERCSAELIRLTDAIASAEREIEEAGGGVGIADLEAEVQGVDPDTLPGQIEVLTGNIDDELEPRRTELAQTKGREQKELELMDGSDRAAQVAEQTHAVLASIRADAERYVQVKLASSILRDQIERYRRENQGPLIKRASEHFSSLTLSSFDGLVTDFNDKDEPVLVGLRGGGEKVFVEGMSSGTRDQLYLALRLASLERYMDSAESMPFIVDDILVDFDDDRSEAALREMSDLSKKGQVILFTHHARVVEQAQAILSAELTTIHNL